MKEWLGVWLLFSLVLCGCGERPISHYSTWTQAKKDNAMGRGWLPEFLPKSATSISEMHDLDTNRGCFVFSLSPDDLADFAAQLEPLDPMRMKHIAGSTLSPPRLSWWPPELRSNTLEDLVKQGWVAGRRREADYEWHFILDMNNGKGYGWHGGR